jgi:hypothetical protein
MTIINVVKAFTYQHEPEQTGTTKDREGNIIPVYALAGEMQRFEVGEQDVPDHVADNWYVQAHCEGFVDPPPKLAQPDYAQKMLIAGRAARNATSMEEAAPQPAPLPPGVTPPPERHYFAGKKQEDTPAPPAPSWMTGRVP